MGGTSDRENEAQSQLQQQKGFQSDLTSGKYNVKNRFDNYADVFDYGDMTSQLDDIFGKQTDIINRDTADTIAQQQQGAASSLASRGITGGSILTDTNSGIASNINKSKTNALANLGIGKASSLSDLMKYFNQEKLNTTQAATNVDSSNASNVLGSLSNSYELQQNLLGGLDDTTGWDDIFGVIKTGVGSAGGIAELMKALKKG